MKSSFYIITFVFITFLGYGRFKPDSLNQTLLPKTSHILFSENKGQWNQHVLYQGKLRGGKVFLEKTGFSYVFYPKQGLEAIYHKSKNSQNIDGAVTFHALKMEFVNCNLNSFIQEVDSNSFFENYFIGKDQTKWVSHIKSYKQVVYEELYKGIKVKSFSNKNDFRFDFIIKPGASIGQIAMLFKGQNSLKLKDGDLIINTDVGDITQKAPFSYQIIDGKIVIIDVEYALEKNIVKLKVKQNYDKRFPLVVDPTLVFATYTGSLSDNFGMTATYDVQGNAYTAGNCFGVGYPLTAGAFQINYMGGTGYPCDISISKFNTSGSNLLYSTYLGGTDNEEPESIVVDNLGQLVVLGRTLSTDFPVTSNVFQTVNHGENDLIITKFNSSGTALIASTYMGGSQNDGVNSTYPFSQLYYNYCDDLRGCVIVDDFNEIYVCGSTNSADFPVTSGCYQNALNGVQDACIIKFDPNLTQPVYSSFFGGSSSDGAYNIALDDNNRLYVTGGTLSSDFYTTSGSLHPTVQGGVDGFISFFSNDGNSILASTYLGTSSYDQSYFVQLDKQNRVFVFGQTEGAYPVSSGVYSNPNSGQFIHCLNSNLTSTFFSTVIGSGDAFPDIVPSAFLVDVCGNIYLSGWGGSLNGNNELHSSTFDLPVTSDAYISSTDGNDFYFMVLNKNAQTLQYATFFGGNISHEHVDGGTSKFDKSGIIYQAICESCGGNDDMPTTPGVWSSQNGCSFNCNNAIVKFSFNSNLTVAQLAANLPSTSCYPYDVNFINNSINGVNYFWDFGDGTVSTSVSPAHTYTAAGVYTVQLISNNDATCNMFDTTIVVLNVISPPSITLIPFVNLCKGDTAILNLSAPIGCSYTWTPSTFLNTSNIEDPATFAQNNLTYTVNVEQNGCSSTDTVQVRVLDNTIKILQDSRHLCLDDTIKLSANQVCSSYQWSNGQSTQQIDVFNPGWYYLSTIFSGCKSRDSIRVDSFFHVPINTNTLVLCLNEKLQIHAPEGHYSYFWQPNYEIDDTSSYSPIVSPQYNTTYSLTIFNGPCKSTGTYDVRIYALPSLTVSPKLITIYSGEEVNLTCLSDTVSLWGPNYMLTCTFCNNSVATTDSNITYYATVYNKYGCKKTDSIKVQVRPTIYIPNCFTPNGDFLNDVFKPEYKGYVEVELLIFDRWGVLIFRTEELNAGWNGKYKDVDCKSDVYSYKLKAKDYFHKTLEKVGHVTLLR